MPTTFSTAVSGDDTQYDSIGGTFSNSGSTLKAYKNGSTNNFKTSFRFPNVTIPQGATINACDLKVRPYNYTLSNNFEWKVKGNDVDDAVAPTSAGEFAALALTTHTAYGQVTASAWNAVIGTGYYTLADYGGWDVNYKLSTIIQDIVNRPGWASGNALQITLETETSNGDTPTMYALDAGSYAAQIVVTYTSALTVPGQLTTSGIELQGSLADQSDGSIAGAGSVLTSGIVTGPFSSHEQSFSTPLVIVTMAAPYGSISLTDEPDALSIEVGAEIALEDAEDAFSIIAAFGSFGTISLTDVEDVFTSIPGGDVDLSDSLDSFTITGVAEAIATAGLSDSLDTFEVDALSGGLAECSMVDAADLLTITGQPEITGGVNLVDASDLFSIQGMGGIASSGIALQDALDGFNVVGAPEETGVIALSDVLDVFSMTGGKLTRFATHIIQYQKTRY